MHALTDKELDLLKNSMFGEFGIYRIKEGKPLPLYISPNLHLACGMTKTEFLATTHDDATTLVAPTDKEQFMKDFYNCCQHGLDMDSRYRIIVKDKGFLWVRARGKICGTLNGDKILLVTYAAELENANNFKDLLDNLEEKVYICDLHTKELLYANKIALQFANKTLNVTKRTTCHKFFMDLDEPCTDCILPKLAHGTATREKYLEKAKIWTKVNMVPIILGRHEAFAIYVQDITTQKKQLEQFKKSIQNLLDTIPDSMGTFILNGTKNTASEGVGCNKEFIKSLNSKTVNGLRKNLLHLIPDRAQRKQVRQILGPKNALANFSQGKANMSCEYQIINHKNELRWVRTTVHFFSNPDSGDIEGVAYSNDITEEVKKRQIFDILTRREFDLVALIYLQSGLFEPVFIGKDLPEAIRQKLPPLGRYHQL